MTASPTSLTGMAPGTGHGQRSRSSSVVVGEVVDRGGAVDPVDAVPQCQRLGVAQQFTDAAHHDQPLAQRAAVGPHCDFSGRCFRRADHRPLGQQVPRAFAAGRVRRVFLVDGQFVAHPVLGDQLSAVADQRRHPSAAGRVDDQPVMLVGNLLAAPTTSRPSRFCRRPAGRPASPATARRAPAS